MSTSPYSEFNYDDDSDFGYLDYIAEYESTNKDIDYYDNDSRTVLFDEEDYMSRVEGFNVYGDGY